MPAYVIADVEVTDAVGFGEYLKAVSALVAARGGTYVARGGAVEVLEGDWVPTRLTILKFDSVAQAKAWYESPEYRPLRDLRKKTTKSKLLIVEGL
ncbi:MAG: DUF1330 domain-containing protein [Deltaproteobacteria bacterium]|nr:DUF1330 domain-containing protein [Deltaproteobacteria bacterium]